MSAAIVFHYVRSDVPDPAKDCKDSLWSDGDLSTRVIKEDIPGQLWERVAERSEQTYRTVWYGGMTPGPRVCEPKGAWILGRHVCPRRDSHGIIRAGEQIK